MASRDASIVGASRLSGCTQFFFKVEFWGLWPVGIMDAILLQLFEEHNSVIKKKRGMEEVIIKPVGSQHILYSLHSILLLCM